MDKWRKIEGEPDVTKAPWDGAAVLVSTGTAVGEAWYCDDDGYFYWANTHPTDFVDGSVLNPTHWQPLPAPPKETPDAG